jgi:hypothetical protein
MRTLFQIIEEFIQVAESFGRKPVPAPIKTLLTTPPHELNDIERARLKRMDRRQHGKV